MSERIEIKVLSGSSQYDVFKSWQEALSRGLRETGAESCVVPAGADPETAGARTLSVGFNLVRNWRVETADRHHLAWTVDHPVYHGLFFLHEESRLPVNESRCLLAVVDRGWLEFARELYTFPHVFFLPHATALESFVRPAWSDRPYDVVLFGSVHNPEAKLKELRDLVSAQNAQPVWPMLQQLTEEFVYGGQSLDQVILRNARRFGWPAGP